MTGLVQACAEAVSRDPVPPNAGCRINGAWRVVEPFFRCKQLPFQRSGPGAATISTKFCYTGSIVWNKGGRGRVHQVGTGLQGDLGTAAAFSYLWVGRIHRGNTGNERVRG